MGVYDMNDVFMPGLMQVQDPLVEIGLYLVCTCVLFVGLRVVSGSSESYFKFAGISLMLMSSVSIIILIIRDVVEFG